MKEKVKTKGSKKIIIIIVMIMLCNFIMPKYTYAADTNNGGDIFDPFIKFITFLCDSVMQFLQNSFTSNASIDNYDGTYDFQYSPAIIFSGTVQGLDINFITPKTDERNTNNFEAFLRTEIPFYVEMEKMCWANGEGYKDLKESEYKESLKKRNEEYYNEYLNLKNKITESDKYKVIREEGRNNIYHYNYKQFVYYYEENNMLYVIFFETREAGDISYCYYETSYEINNDFLNNLNATVTYNSIANELQPTIATWYNVLRRIALVGLLSVLVYLGIRIILSSSSAEGNSKYKKMLTDWLIALCLLFTLHYIMSATLVITQKLSSIFTLGTTDELLNTLRAEIQAETGGWGNVLSQVIMYLVIVILTFIFTYQYLRRVLYMAFFTMIAPLITLTYPLDKVNDGKAQAFNMWIREYIFNALIQVVHLIVYYTLVESAMELVKSFPLYGIVAIGFITQGEKIIRSMFGFNNADTVGTMGAVAAGGLIQTAMNKLKKLPTGAKEAGKKGGEKSSRGSSKSKVRTATNNPLSGLQGNKGASQTGESSHNSSTNKSVSGGAEALARKYAKPIAGTALGAFTGGTGAMIGFAAGVAQGDLGAAVTGATVGGAAGMNLGKGAVNSVARVPGGIKNGLNNIRDTYREGAYGEEAANAIKFDEEFRNGSTYKALQNNPKFSEESLQIMLDAGITDKKAMTAILDSGIDTDDAIKYYTVAQNCPPEIFYDKKMLKTFCKCLRDTDDTFQGQSYGKIRDMLGKFM